MLHDCVLANCPIEYNAGYMIMYSCYWGPSALAYQMGLESPAHERVQRDCGRLAAISQELGN